MWAPLTFDHPAEALAFKSLSAENFAANDVGKQVGMEEYVRRPRKPVLIVLPCLGTQSGGVKSIERFRCVRSR